MSADLQLDVKGCRDVYASFDKYVEVERLEGDNKYHAEQYGLQVSCSTYFLVLCNCLTFVEFQMESGQSKLECCVLRCFKYVMKAIMSLCNACYHF